MLITKFDDKLRRTMAVGCGRVIAKDGQSPLQKTATVSGSRIGFAINTGTTIDKKDPSKHTFETMSCAVYNNSWGKQLYDIVTTLKKGDIVMFGGWVHEGKFIDQATGKTRDSCECRIEFICPLNVVTSMLFGVDEKKKKVTDKNIPTKVIVSSSTDDDIMF